MLTPLKEIRIAELGFPRGEPWVVAEVIFTFEPIREGFAERDIIVPIGCSWDRPGETLDSLRLRLVETALELLGGAAALRPEEVQTALETGLRPDPGLDLSRLFDRPVDDQS